MKEKIEDAAQARSHNSRYTLRSSLPSVVAVLGLRHIFSAPAPCGRLFGAEKPEPVSKAVVKARSGLHKPGRSQKGLTISELN